jgi:hypothetical protein
MLGQVIVPLNKKEVGGGEGEQELACLRELGANETAAGRLAPSFFNRDIRRPSCLEQVERVNGQSDSLFKFYAIVVHAPSPTPVASPFLACSLAGTRIHGKKECPRRTWTR